MADIPKFDEIKNSYQSDHKKFGKLLFDNISKMGLDERTKAIKYLCKEENVEILSCFMDNLKLKKQSVIGSISKLLDVVRKSNVGADEASILVGALGESYYKQNFKIDNSLESQKKQSSYGVLFGAVYNYKSFITQSTKEQANKLYNKEYFIKDVKSALKSPDSFDDAKLEKIYDSIVLSARGSKLTNLVKGVRESIKRFASGVKK